jgi:hypothetical protein
LIAGFLWIESEVGETLAGAHLSWAQDQMVWLNGADRVPVLGEIELDGSRGVIGFEPADFGLADSAEFFEREEGPAQIGVKYPLRVGFSGCRPG